MGVAIAYWLARRGASVQLLEARELCFGATGRNLGLFLPSASSLERPDLLVSVLAEEGIDADFKEVGHLALTQSPDTWKRIVREVQRRPPEAPRLEAVDREGCERLLGMKLSGDIIGGRWYAAGRVIDPARLTLGLASAASRYGARVAQGQSVREVVSRGSTFSTRTDTAVISTRQVVLACNAWTRTLVPELSAVLRAVPAQVLATAPGRGRLTIALALDWGTVYWRQLSNGVTIAGGFRHLDRAEDNKLSLSINPRVHDAVTSFLTSIFPGYPLPAVRRRWAAVMDQTPDGRPVIGRLRPNGAWIAAGLGGHGLPPTMALAHCVAMGLCDGALPREVDDFCISRFAELMAAGRRLDSPRGPVPADAC